MTAAALPKPAELLPHAPPMVLLDEMVHADDERAVSRVHVRPTSPFFEDGGVPALVAIEYMAQTVGAWAGFRRRRDGEPPRIGYLLGTRELRLHADHFPAGAVLEVEIRRVWGETALGQFDAVVLQGGAVVAEGRLSVYEGAGDPEEAP